jgi:hypothetical protein
MVSFVIFIGINSNSIIIFHCLNILYSSISVKFQIIGVLRIIRENENEQQADFELKGK